MSGLSVLIASNASLPLLASPHTSHSGRGNLYHGSNKVPHDLVIVHDQIVLLVRAPHYFGTFVLVPAWNSTLPSKSAGQARADETVAIRKSWHLAEAVTPVMWSPDVIWS